MTIDTEKELSRRKEAAQKEAEEKNLRVQKLTTRLKGQLDELLQAKASTQEITARIAASAEEIRKTVKTNAAFHGDLDLEQEATLMNIVSSNMRLAGVIHHALSRAQSLDHRLLAFYAKMSAPPVVATPEKKSPRTTAAASPTGMVDSLTNSIDALFDEVPDL